MASRSRTGARPARRGGLSIRWRLTAWYAGIFLVLGAALLALSYALVSQTLGPDASRTPIVYRVPSVLARGPGTGASTATGTQRVLARRRARRRPRRGPARRDVHRGVAGLYPAFRAARLSPTEALRA